MERAPASQARVNPSPGDLFTDRAEAAEVFAVALTRHRTLLDNAPRGLQGTGTSSSSMVLAESVNPRCPGGWKPGRPANRLRCTAGDRSIHEPWSRRRLELTLTAPEER